MNQEQTQTLNPIALLKLEYGEVNQLLDIQAVFLKACISALLDFPPVTPAEMELRKSQVSRLITVLKFAYEYKRTVEAFPVVPNTPQVDAAFTEFDTLQFFRTWVQNVVTQGEKGPVPECQK